jgi:hypothetical protein
VAALARWRASQRHLSSWGLSGRTFSQSDDRCCTRKYAAQSLVRRVKFGPIPSCVCRWDTSVVQQWNMSYAHSPTLRPHREKGPHGSMFRRPTGLSPGALSLANVRRSCGVQKPVPENGTRKLLQPRHRKRVLHLDCGCEQVGGESRQRNGPSRED